MNIFNSLGSNYNFKFVLKSLFSFSGSSKELDKMLEEKYQGKATLLYKGRQALALALTSLDLPRGSSVAVCGFTCVAVYQAIKKVGLNVEFLDIEKSELNFSAQTLDGRLQKNPQIKVVIVQNTLGYPCEIEQIAKICQQNNLTLIEDLAHCVGARYKNGKEAGTVGDLVVLSFSQDKMIDGISGGALITMNKKSYPLPVTHARYGLRRHVRNRLYPLFTYLIRNTYSIGIGKIFHTLLKSLRLLSNPMDQLDHTPHQLPVWYCYLINSAFANLPDSLDHRKKIASVYAQNLNPKIISPKIISSINLSSNLRFPIFVNNREKLINYLKQSGVYVADIWYDEASDQCPNAQLAAQAILNLPTHRQVCEKDAQNIAQLINQWLKSQ